MRKLWFPFAAAAIIVLAACSSTSGAPKAAASPTATPAISMPKIPTQDSKAVSMTCRVVSIVPTPEPTETSLFPPAGPQDWVLGKESAVMTLTEYSDYM